jgi:hypothetical protein
MFVDAFWEITTRQANTSPQRNTTPQRNGLLI